MIGSILPDTVIEWGTDIVFLAALVAAVVYGVKRTYGFINRNKD